MDELYQLFFNIIRGSFDENLTFSDDFRSQIQENYDDLLTMAKRHDIVPLFANSIIKHQLIGGSSLSVLEKQNYAQIKRMMKIKFQQSEIMRVFEEQSIPFVIMKGTIMRGLYPEFWMRTSCDVDILVHEDDLDRAVEALKTSLSYRIEGCKHYHDINLFSLEGIHLELHYNIQETIDSIDKELKNVWDYLTPLDGYKYGFQETPEFFVFHHLAHMSYHFVGGGCGIRPVIDLWIINQKIKTDEVVLDKLLGNCGLLKFRKTMNHLAMHWMEGKEINTEEKTVEEYILNGGTYGIADQAMAVKKEKAGGKGTYYKNRIFMPYDSLVFAAPWVKDRKYLLPVAEVVRWMKLLNKDTYKRVKREMETHNNLDADEQQRIVGMMKSLELM